MEGDKFSMFAQNYLKKRPRLTSDDRLPGGRGSSTARLSGRQPDDLVNYDDEEIFIWQEQQMSRCIVDNTVNRVVETYLSLHHDNADDDDDDDDDSVSVDDAPPNDYGEQGSFEESFAVTRAINDIGLQRNYGSMPSTSQQTSAADSLRPSLLFADTWTENGPVSESQNAEQPTAADGVDDVQRETRATASSCDVGEIADTHLEFMEAAVSVAIQEKGLAPLSNK